MPFTLAHPAAVLPLARSPLTRLVPSALVAGSVAPDLPYYVSLLWIGGDYNLPRTHAATSLLWLDPAIALVLLAAFHLLLERPLVALLPVAAAARVRPGRFSWRPIGWIVLSAALGAATHLVWDAFGDAFGYRWSGRVNLAGSVAGLAVLAIWLRRWWQRAEPEPLRVGATLPVRTRVAVLAATATAAATYGAIRVAAVLPELDGFATSDVVNTVVRTFTIAAATAAAVVMLGYAVLWQAFRSRSA